jgi:alkanesulfonate monooxygenase SsuD/methylene tetrahydromethanopterin reductase-like flavin-dependent oxidoreductase (luciferase family)
MAELRGSTGATPTGVGTREVRRAVGVPNIGEYADPRVIGDLAALAERSGWDGLFLWDHLGYRGDEPVTDPQVAIAAAAAVTERIRLGICVVQLGRRRPAKVAREVVALDQLSGGRMVLGVGLGSYAGDFTLFGDAADPVVRGRKTDEGLAVIDGLWSGEPFRFQGEHFQVHGAQFLPVAVQRPRVPVWVAGTWPNKPGFRRAARWDGTFPTFRDVPGDGNVPPELLDEAVSYVRAHRPPGPGPFDVVLEGATPGAPPLEEYAEVGLTWWIEKLGWWRGDLEHTRRRIQDGPPGR